MQNGGMNQPTLPTPNARVKIFVVDDHPNTAATLARAIAQLGSKVEVVSATSGYEALERVKEGAVDILITDMVMPGMSGLELIEQLQNHPAGRPAFSFLMTAYDVLGLRVTAHRLKVKDVIVKPIHPERICQIITQAIQEMDQESQLKSLLYKNHSISSLQTINPITLTLLRVTWKTKDIAISLQKMAWKRLKRHVTKYPI